MNSFTLQNKHILITGASSGIGRQCAILFSHMGARVTIVGRNTERLNETASHCEVKKTHLIISDILDTNSIENGINESVHELGKIDGIVNAAGIEKTLPFKLHKKDVVTEILETNVIGSLEITRIASQKKRFNSGGSIIFVSSIMGIVGNPGLTGYSASKGALIAATKTLCLELAPRKIRVNSISPGHIVGTAMSDGKENNLSEEAVNHIVKAHPLGLGDTEDIANAVIYLLSDASKWVTGTNLIIDGGYSAK